MNRFGSSNGCNDTGRVATNNRAVHDLVNCRSTLESKAIGVNHPAIIPRDTEQLAPQRRGVGGIAWVCLRLPAAEWEHTEVMLANKLLVQLDTSPEAMSDTRSHTARS